MFSDAGGLLLPAARFESRKAVRRANPSVRMTMPVPPEAPLFLHQVNFVFAEGAPLLRFIPDVTMGDIARLLGEPAGTATLEPAAAWSRLCSTRVIGRHSPRGPNGFGRV
ncbi:MAG: hypothetical protein H7345_16900 [Rubritepida sp.]|nr:hypothetical protein [Rubritepida sp.]